MNKEDQIRDLIIQTSLSLFNKKVTTKLLFKIL